MDFSRTFTDSLGREWTVEIGLPQARRMQELAGVTIEELAPELDPKKSKGQLAGALAPVERFLADPFRTFDVFYALVKPLADKRGLTKEQVEEGINSEAARDGMVIAILRAIYDFFRWNSARQQTVKRIAQFARELMTKAEERMDKAAESADVGKILDEGLAIAAEVAAESPAEPSKSGATDSEDTPASTPNPIAYDS